MGGYVIGLWNLIFGSLNIIRDRPISCSTPWIGRFSGRMRWGCRTVTKIWCPAKTKIVRRKKQFDIVPYRLPCFRLLAL